MPTRITLLNQSTIKKQITNKSNMTTKITTYDYNYINNFRYNINKTLPEKTMKILNLSTKIKTVMNKKDLEIFNKKLDDFDAEELQKKINSLLNKLTSANFETIYQKTSVILKNRKVLIEFTIKNLMEKAIQMSGLIDVYSKFYKKLYTLKTEQIFQDTFTELMDVLNGKIDSKINSAKDYDKFCKYIKDKGKYTGLHILLASLYELKIIKKKQLVDQIKTLETTILKSTPEENEKYAECYCKLLKKLNKKEFINIKKVNEIKSAGVLKIRMKFAIMDIQDLHKSL